MNPTQTWLDDVTEELCIASILRDSKTISGLRLAMILVDNVVEFIIKVHGEDIIPGQGKVLTRKEWEEKKRHFEELVGLVIPRTPASAYQQQIVDYHRIRNDLYHGSTPLTVTPDKINNYMKVARKLLELIFGFTMKDDEWERKTAFTEALLVPKGDKKGLVNFAATDDGLVKMTTDVRLTDTDAIQLMIYGFLWKTGSAPNDIEELGKGLNYSGHSIKQDLLSVKISQLRKAKKINTGELSLTKKAREQIRSKYLLPP